jgi:hypothetical protein
VHIMPRNMAGTFVKVVVNTVCAGNRDKFCFTNMKPESLTLVDYIAYFNLYECWQLQQMLCMCLYWQP